MTIENSLTSTPTTDSNAATPISHRLNSDDGKLSIAFHWRKDRYDHVIALVNGAKNQSLYRSVNGSIDEDWPASPAIQQLSTETIEGKTTVLGVGCCGSSHFSVSVQPATTRDGSEAIRFEWAVRLSKELSQTEIDAIEGFWLGTTYLAAKSRDPWRPNIAYQFEAMDNAAFEMTKQEIQTNYCLRPLQTADQRTIQWSYFVQPKPGK